MAVSRFERVLGQLLALLVLFAFVACNAILGNESTTAEFSPEAGQGGACVPRACDADECGSRDDGCGGTITCSCREGSVCNGSRCVCSTTACTDLQCGDVERSCGKTLRCGSTCAIANHECNGNECSCKARTCEEGSCGLQTDGCDGDLSCPACTGTDTCGGTEPDKCGPGTCQPRSCDVPSKFGQYCGRIGNGCGTEILNCNAPCPAGETCGGGGTANVCGCTPQTCERADATCGTVPSGCPLVADLECGSCAAPATCGGGGIANQCGCTPLTCATAKATCGTPSDGCGNVLPSCGACPAGQVCNSNFTCAPSCSPLSQQIACTGRCGGGVSNGCGGTYDCGACGGDAVCTALGVCCAPVANLCKTRCGTVADPSCGTTVECGQCTGDNEVCVDSECVCAGGVARCRPGLSACCAPTERCGQFGCVPAGPATD